MREENHHHLTTRNSVYIIPLPNLRSQTTNNTFNVEQNVGKWTPEEHQIFLQAYQEVGRNWQAIAHRLKTRTKQQVRSHAQKYFLKKQREDEIARINNNFSANGFQNQMYLRKKPKINYADVENGTVVFDGLRTVLIPRKRKVRRNLQAEHFINNPMSPINPINHSVSPINHSFSPINHSVNLFNNDQSNNIPIQEQRPMILEEDDNEGYLNVEDMLEFADLSPYPFPVMNYNPVNLQKYGCFDSLEDQQM